MAYIKPESAEFTPKINRLILEVQISLLFSDYSMVS